MTTTTELVQLWKIVQRDLEKIVEIANAVQRGGTQISRMQGIKDSASTANHNIECFLLDLSSFLKWSIYYDNEGKENLDISSLSERINSITKKHIREIDKLEKGKRKLQVALVATRRLLKKQKLQTWR